jgi:hypothetical protein
MIVGGDDTEVIDLNKQARQRMQAETELLIVPGATHLFEEPGTLEQVAKAASDWFAKYLTRRGAERRTKSGTSSLNYS